MDKVTVDFHTLFEELLKGNKELILKTCDYYGDYDPFPQAIWDFFESHGGIVDFYQAIAEAEMKENETDQFSPVHFAGKLLFLEYYGETGKKYVEDISKVLFEASLGVTKREKGYSTQIFEAFISQIENSVHYFPLTIRKCLLVVFKCMTGQLSQSKGQEKFMRLLLERFYLPIVRHPWVYNDTLEAKDLAELENDTLFKKLERKIIRLFPQNYEVLPTEQKEKYAPFRSSFIKFTSSLTDENDLKKVERVLETSFKAPKTLLRKEAKSLLSGILRGSGSKDLSVHLHMKKTFDMFLKYLTPDEWKLVSTHKDRFQIYSRKFEDSPFLAWKMVGSFECEPRFLHTFFHDAEMYMKIEPRAKNMRTVETFPDIDGHKIIDLYNEIILPFPMSCRDQLVKRFLRDTDDLCVSWNFSIERADLPPRKNFIRTQVAVSGSYIKRDEKNPKFCNLTCIYQGDPRGSFPIWLVNYIGKDNINFLIQIEKLLQEMKHDEEKKSSKQS